MKKISSLLIVFILVSSLVGCFSSESERKEPSLKYTIVSDEIDGLQRQIIRAYISKEDRDSATKEDLTQFLKDMVQYELPYNYPRGMSIFLYAEGDDYNNTYTVGMIDYAPNGEWGDIATCSNDRRDYTGYDYYVVVRSSE